jgi:hypothetical protein
MQQQIELLTALTILTVLPIPTIIPTPHSPAHAAADRTDEIREDETRAAAGAAARAGEAAGTVTATGIL